MNPSHQPEPRADMKSRIKRVLLSRPVVIAAAALAFYTLVGFFLAPYLVKRYVPRSLESALGTPATIGSVRMNPFLLTAEVTDFSLREKNDRTLAGFHRLFVNFQLSSLFRWAWTFRDIRLDSPSARIVIEKDGALNWAKLGPAVPDPPAPGPDSPDDTDADSEKSGPVRLLVHAVAIEDGKIDIADLRQSRPAALAVHPVDIALNNISTLADREGAYTLGAKFPDGGTFRWEGRVSLAPIASSGSLSIESLKAATLWPFARDALNLSQPRGALGVKLGYDLAMTEGSTKAVVDDLEIRLSDLALQMEEEPEPFLALTEIALKGGRVDPVGRTVGIGALSIRGGRLGAGIGADGRVNLQNILRSNPTTSPSKPPSPPGAPWRLKVDRFAVDDVNLAFTDASRKPSAAIHAGPVDLALKAAVETGPGPVSVKLTGIESRIQGTTAALEGASRPIIDIPVIAVTSGAVDLADRSITIDAVEMSGGKIAVARDAAGGIDAVKLIPPAKADVTEKKPDPPSDAQDPWQFMVRKIGISDFRSSFIDAAVNPEKPVFGLEGVSLELLDVDGRSPSTFTLAMTAVQGGRLSAGGTIDPAGPAAEVNLDVADLDLTPVQPYITPYVDVEMLSGRFSTKGTLRHGAEKARAKTVYVGKIQVDDFRVVETGSKETLLGWSSLQTGQLRLHLSPNRLAIDEIVLSKPAGKLFIDQDGTVNVVKIIKTPPKDKTVAKSAPEAPSNEFPIRISKVRLADGSLDFTDLSLTPPFGTEIGELSGVVIGMSSEKNTRAQVKLEGRVNEYGSARIEGEINTFDPKAFMDIAMIFQNLEMTRLSPYSGKFAGRRIRSGKISLDLEYKIDNGQMLGDNQIIVDRLILGEKVESPDAANLPLDLAVALLQDADGVIDIGLPVRGNLNDPQFSFGGIIWKAFTNLITKIATAPFRALGALLGIEGKDLEAVAFEPGSATPSPPEREKLDKLREALKQRPQLQVVVTGRYDAQADGRVLRERRVRRTLAEKRQTPLKPGEDPGPVDFSNRRVRKTLEKWFEERFGGEAADQLEEEIDAAEKTQSPDPGRAAKTIFERLVEAEPLEPKALENLAAERATAVVKVLTGENGIPGERVSTGPPEAKSGKNAASAGLALEAKSPGAAGAPKGNR